MCLIVADKGMLVIGGSFVKVVEIEGAICTATALWTRESSFIDPVRVFFSVINQIPSFFAHIVFSVPITVVMRKHINKIWVTRSRNIQNFPRLGSDSAD